MGIRPLETTEIRAVARAFAGQKEAHPVVLRVRKRPDHRTGESRDGQSQLNFHTRNPLIEFDWIGISLPDQQCD